MGPEPPSFSKAKYSLFARLSSIARGGLAQAKASGIMCSEVRLRNYYNAASIKSKYSIFARLSRIARGGLAPLDVG